MLNNIIMNETTRTTKLKTDLGASKSDKKPYVYTPKEQKPTAKLPTDSTTTATKLDEKFHAPDTSESLQDSGILSSILSNYKLTPKDAEESKEETNPLLEKYKNKKEKTPEDKLIEKLEEVKEILNLRIAQESFGRKVLTSFFTGTIGALGATVGFTLLVLFLGFLYNNFQEAPFIGDLIQNSRIIELISETLSSQSDIVE